MEVDGHFTTLLAILMKGIPLVIPYCLRSKAIVPVIAPEVPPLLETVSVSFSVFVAPRIVTFRFRCPRWQPKYKAQLVATDHLLHMAQNFASLVSLAGGHIPSNCQKLRATALWRDTVWSAN